MRVPYLLLFVSSGALAQNEAQPISAESSMVGATGGDVRSQAADWMIMPKGEYAIGGTLSFLTSDIALDGTTDDGLKFTDVVLLGLETHFSLGGKAEIGAGTAILPKQPSTADENVWQGAHAGVKIGFGKRYAFSTQLAAGPMIGKVGWWGQGELGVQARKSIDPTVVFQGALGGGFTGLRYDADTSDEFWLAEVAADAEIVFRVPNNYAAGWLGTQFRFPVASNPGQDDPDPRTGMFIEPRTRVLFRLGVVLAYIDSWDLYSELIISDRGDAKDPGTTLPMLDGGFDQKQLMFGITHRFRKSEAHHPDLHLAF